MMYAEGNFLGSSSSSDNESGYDDSSGYDDDAGATVITVNGKIVTAGKVKPFLNKRLFGGASIDFTNSQSQFWWQNHFLTGRSWRSHST